MQQRIAHIALVVRDYDEAIEFYTKKLNFTLVEDTVLSKTKRWVIVRPPGSNGTGLLLAKAANEEQKSRIGNQTGGRVFLFLTPSYFYCLVELCPISCHTYLQKLLQFHILLPPALLQT